MCSGIQCCRELEGGGEAKGFLSGGSACGLDSGCELSKSLWALWMGGEADVKKKDPINLERQGAG